MVDETPEALEVLRRDPVMAELLDRAERLTRQAISRIRPGTYSFEDYLDDDGINRDALVRIRGTTFLRTEGSLQSRGLSLPEVTDLARAFPDTMIILDHFGGPIGIGSYAGRREEIFPVWKASIQEIAKCENVVVKLGGLAMRGPTDGERVTSMVTPSPALRPSRRTTYRFDTCTTCSMKCEM